MTDKTVKNLGRVGVLMGGVSSEREISLKSGQAVTAALTRHDCDVHPIDLRESGEEKILTQLKQEYLNVAFIALHGRMGEDGTIQSLLEMAGIPYTGSGVEASRLAMNKSLAQNLFKKNNINVPSYVTLSKNDRAQSEAVIQHTKKFPVVVKPAREGSSIGVSLVTSAQELPSALEYAWQFDDILLMEEYIRGRELTVGILGEEPLLVVEIFPKKGFFDFESKYSSGQTDYVVPAKIPVEKARQLQHIALKAHRVLGCADVSRVDFLLDEKQVPFLLEVNTIPGFTATSLLPKAAMAGGMTFDQLCLQLVESAYGKKKETKYYHPKVR